MVTFFLLQLAATLFMTGLIWFVQVVHYPLFAEVGPECLARYELLHARRTTWIVFPPMLLELLTSVAWLYSRWRPAFVPVSMAWVLAGLVGVIWLTTGLRHVPLHTRLGQVSSTESAGVLRLLVDWNWVRTAAWTARAAGLVTVLRRAM